MHSSLKVCGVANYIYLYHSNVYMNLSGQKLSLYSLLLEFIFDRLNFNKKSCRARYKQTPYLRLSVLFYFYQYEEQNVFNA